MDKLSSLYLLEKDAFQGNFTRKPDEDTKLNEQMEQNFNSVYSQDKQKNAFQTIYNGVRRSPSPSPNRGRSSNHAVTKVKNLDKIYVQRFERNLDLASLGNPIALYIIGQSYDLHYGVLKNENKANEYYKLAAKKGNFLSLGICHYLGIDEYAKNHSRAAEYFQLSADQGNSEALNWLGQCYLQAKGVERSDKKAIECFQLSVDMKNDRGMFNLAHCYFNGIGVKKDINRALELFKQSALQDNDESLLNIGLSYYFGDGIEKDPKKAFEYFLLSANLQNSDALFQLGICYYYGVGVEVDLKTAIEFFFLAEKSGHSHAQFNLGVFYKNGDGVEKSLSKAVHYFMKSANQGYEAALLSLGDCYLNGEGVEKDLVKARNLYRAAVEKGNVEAQTRLNEIKDLNIFELKDFNSNQKLRKSHTAKKSRYPYEFKEFKYDKKTYDKDEEFEDLMDYMVGKKDKIKLSKTSDSNLGRVNDKSDPVPLADEQGREINIRSINKSRKNYHSNLIDYNNNNLPNFKYESKSSKDLQSQPESIRLYNLGIDYEVGIGMEEDFEKAFEKFKQAAKEGSAQAIFRISQYYKYGIVVEQNIDEYFKFLKYASEKGCLDALNELGSLYENGEIVPKDEKNAIEFYQEASKLGNIEKKANLDRLLKKHKSITSEILPHESNVIGGFKRKASTTENSNFLPCGHSCCRYEFAKTIHEKFNKCPLCRKEFDELMERIFHS